MTSDRVRRVLLVGFMGAGKSTVGRLVADRLGWPFVDFDDRIELLEGSTVPEIFRRRGEAHFRALEREVGASLLLEDRVVLGSGGGWPAAAGRMRGLPCGTLSVWLKVSAEEAVRRAADQGDKRPLLGVDEAVTRSRALLAERSKYYAQAWVSVETEGRTPAQVAGLVIAAVDEAVAAANGGNGRSREV